MGAGWDLNNWKQSAIRCDGEFPIAQPCLVSAKIWTRKSQQGGPITSRDINICVHEISGVINP